MFSRDSPQNLSTEDALIVTGPLLSPKVGRLSESLEYVSCSGVFIRAEKLEFLKNSLVLLQKENHFKKIYYWGKIIGSENDYHIAYGYMKDCIKDQIYYYSLNCLDWLLLPKVIRTARVLTPFASHLFQGNPSNVSIIDVADELFTYNVDETTIILESPIPKKLKEEDRLAVTIDMINKHTMVIPRGSWLRHQGGEIIENPAFFGCLNLNESAQLKSYLHARPPQAEWNENLLKIYDYNYGFDFLDPIHVDIPEKSWNLQLHSKNNTIILQNLCWPGMTFYHIINSPYYGSIYVGNGKKNLNVPFMSPFNMSIIDIKFTKFDNTPWGFRLAGGSDFPQPLTVIKVSEGSLAECMGLKLGDVIVRLNDRPVVSMTHGQAHEAIVLAGNNFTLGISRTKELQEAVDAIQSETFVPYTIPLEDILLNPMNSIDKPYENEIIENNQENGEKSEESKGDVLDVSIPDKPVDENSEFVPNKNLTDDEIAQLIIEEEELLAAGDQSVLGVNFKKLRPRAPLLKESKVLEELQSIALEDPPQLQEIKHKSTFLQKPERPIPQSKKTEELHAIDQSQGYKVVIVKQTKKSVIERLSKCGILDPDNSKVVEPPMSEFSIAQKETRIAITPEVDLCSRPASKVEIADDDDDDDDIDNDGKEVNNCEIPSDGGFLTDTSDINDCCKSPCNVVEMKDEELIELSKTPESQAPIFDKEKIKQLVSTELSLEKQLENVQSQLIALKQLPSEIENHLRIVTEQLHKIMELSGVQNGLNETGSRRSSLDQEEIIETDSCRESKYIEEDHTLSKSNEDISGSRSSLTMSDQLPAIVEPIQIENEELEEIEPPEMKELTMNVLSEDRHVKKCVASYETRVFRSRDPSPAPSYGSYEPDPNLSPKDQIIQELKHRGGRKRSHDLWPQAKQLELTYGRRWRCPNDFFNDEMIAEVLSGQAEVIRGRALGVNFKKYEKEWLPNYDHLMNSSVYKMLHKLEREPKTGIPARPPKVPAAEDILERVNTPA
ncbi:hypothetical protein PV328_009130 [Microctonus aethiopoides]|uniref:Radial spoke head protein 9 homolog n=1 Tax=Microctonus aethiopoides TaxID=144406 RepID=A0AA39FKQ8_9HYME|nr:hypothetical protein PV328_009130 [Microctonus aethiopoides]